MLWLKWNLGGRALDVPSEHQPVGNPAAVLAHFAAPLFPPLPRTPPALDGQSQFIRRKREEFYAIVHYSTAVGAFVALSLAAYRGEAGADLIFVAILLLAMARALSLASVFINTNAGIKKD